MKYNQRRAQFFAQEQAYQTKQRTGGLFTTQWCIDLTRPLLQLFLLSFLPWIVITKPNHSERWNRR